mgnify:FL=1
MRQICVLLTKYSDWISTLVYHIGGRGFTHSSIALEEDESTYFIVLTIGDSRLKQ